MTKFPKKYWPCYFHGIVHCYQKGRHSHAPIKRKIVLRVALSHENIISSYQLLALIFEPVPGNERAVNILYQCAVDYEKDNKFVILPEGYSGQVPFLYD